MSVSGFRGDDDVVVSGRCGAKLSGGCGFGVVCDVVGSCWHSGGGAGRGWGGNSESVAARSELALGSSGCVADVCKCESYSVDCFPYSESDEAAYSDGASEW